MTNEIRGYQPQTDTNVDKINAVKVAEEKALRLLDQLETDPNVDRRALALARTNLNQFSMWATRAVANPSRIDVA